MSRRIERRMRVHQIEKAREYAQLLEANPHELDLLFKELLITVTSFFRDPEVFVELASRLEERIKALPGDYTFRVWVPGCATGEEAYSLAILLQEIVERRERPLQVQIFATDLDDRAIDTARSGLYPEGIARRRGRRAARAFLRARRQRLPREQADPRNGRLCRTERAEGPAVHPAGSGFVPQPAHLPEPGRPAAAPVCAALRVEAGRHAAAGHLGDGRRPGGSVRAARPQVAALRAQGGRPQRAAVLRLRGSGAAIVGRRESARRGEIAFPVRLAIEVALLERFAPPTAVVNERGDIAYLHGRTGAFLEPSSGEPRNNLFAMAREGLEHELPALVRMASDQAREVTRRRVHVRTNGDFADVDLLASPIQEPESVRGLIRVSFQRTEKPAVEKAQRRGGRVKELEQELRQTHLTLQSTIEDEQSTNEELQSANEELQSTNEELQSANEELETSREELQSLNEELQTVNSELMLKNDELAQANDDMQNLLQSTDIATLFLDTDLKIKRYTSQLREVINADPRRRGSSPRGSGDEPPLRSARRGRRGGAPHADASRGRGADHRRRVAAGAHLPYRTSLNVIDGVVITVIDIDRIEARGGAGSVARFCGEYRADGARASGRAGSGARGRHGQPRIFENFGLDPEQVKGKRLVDLGGSLWAKPELKELLKQVVSEGKVFEDFEVEHELPGVGRRHLLSERSQSRAGLGRFRSRSAGTGDPGRNRFALTGPSPLVG